MATKNVRFRCSSCPSRTHYHRARRNGFTCKHCGAPLRAQKQQLAKTSPPGSRPAPETTIRV